MLASEKMRGPVAWTAASQRDAMTLLELHHDVVAYEAWPLAVSITVDGEEAEYHPSIGMTLADGGKVVIDLVRPDEEGTDARRALDILLADALRSLGIQLIIMSERALRTDPRLVNARTILRSSGWPVSPEAEFGCVRLLADRGLPMTLGELLMTGAQGPELSGTACVLAMRRVLAIDLHAQAANDCSVRLPRREAA